MPDLTSMLCDASEVLWSNLAPLPRYRDSSFWFSDFVVQNCVLEPNRRQKTEGAGKATLLHSDWP